MGKSDCQEDFFGNEGAKNTIPAEKGENFTEKGEEITRIVEHSP